MKSEPTREPLALKKVLSELAEICLILENITFSGPIFVALRKSASERIDELRYSLTMEVFEATSEYDASLEKELKPAAVTKIRKKKK